MSAVAQAINVLEVNGYVVIRRKSYIALMQRLAVARAEARWCREEQSSTRAWADETSREMVRLRDRISFLYRAARAAGATIDDLCGNPTGEPR